MPDTAEQILIRAAQLVEQGWCRFSAAQDDLGTPLRDPLSPNAVKWCAIGALCRAAGGGFTEPNGLELEAERRLGNYLMDRFGTAHLSHWNDGIAHDAIEVAAALRAAAAEHTKEVKSC